MRQAASLLDPQQRTILTWTIIHRLFALLVLQLSAQLIPHFDSSASLLLLSSTPPTALSALLTPLIRWDTLHFIGVGSPSQLPPARPDQKGDQFAGGYEFEHSLAFQAFLPAILRAAGHRDGTWMVDRALVGATALAWVASILSPVLLYSLTLKLFGSRKFAQVAGLLSILSPSPATLISPTPEPFFSFFTLLGLCLLFSDTERKEAILSQPLMTLLASICFAFSTAVRANGILLAGFLLWSGFWGQSRRGNTECILSAAVSILGVSITVAPLIAGQLWAYERFCLQSENRPWCEKRIPSIYAFVQDHYWNVGLLRYWEPAQIPNFALAAPVLWLIAESRGYASGQWKSIGQAVLQPWRVTDPRVRPDEKAGSLKVFDYSRAPEALPHVIFLWINGAILLFMSHVQIALRFASPGGLPGVWWAAAAVLLKDLPLQGDHKSLSQAGKALVTYLVLWNVISLVLYAGFYPPA